MTIDTLNYVARGAGQPVILLHGMVASLYDWERLMPDLAGAGYRAIAADLPGHGDSDGPEELQEYTAEQFFKAVESWLHGLKDGPPFFLVGHSFGGYISLRYTLAHPENVRALVLIAPFYSARQLSWELQAFYRQPFLAMRVMPLLPLGLLDLALGWDPANASFSREARWQTAIDYKRAAPEILNLPRTVESLEQELGNIRTPALVIWGGHDRTLRPDSFPPLVEAMRDARGQAFPHCGHQPHINDPEHVNRMILDFIKTFTEQS